VLHESCWIDNENVALLTDLYELTMLQAYFDSGMNEIAAFDFFVRRLPQQRDYLVACGLEDVLQYLTELHFSDDSINYLRSLRTFSDAFLDHLRGFHFTGDVYAIPEGSIVFPNEPIVEVIAPIHEAQLVETYLMNQIHFQTLAASKAARVVAAAAGKPVIDFGLRRMHGTDAGLKAARAFYIAGVKATSNVLAGKIYGMPVAGTMAHSYVQAHANELEAFSEFVKSFPSTVLLVDTYDTIEGVRHVTELQKRLGSQFRVGGVRLDSGDLAVLSKQARQVLDEAGLQNVEIIVSSSLDEYAIEQLVACGAPIDAFGVGTKMAVSSDAPYLDTAYKLVEYAGRPRMKHSEAKTNLPGRKQVFRQSNQDVIGLFNESIQGEPLLVKVMENGRRMESSIRTLDESRRTLKTSQQSLALRSHPYLVSVSDGIRSLM
jgi:nicotinate phosphoribosyltransferase